MFDVKTVLTEGGGRLDLSKISKKTSRPFLNHVTLGKGEPPVERFKFTVSPTCWTLISLEGLETM